MTLNFVQRCQWVLNSDRRYQEFTDWKDLDLALSRTFQFNVCHKFTEQNYPDLNVVVKEYWYSEGYHKNTVYRVIFVVNYFCHVTLPFYTCKQFRPVFILPRQSRYKHSYGIQKLFWIRLVLSSPTDNEGERSIYNMGMNIFLYTAILFIK